MSFPRSLPRAVHAFLLALGLAARAWAAEPVPFEGRYQIIQEDGIYTLGRDGAKGAGATRRAIPEVEGMTFVMYGDSRSNPEMHTRVARAFMRHDPAFVLHTGDLVGSGGNYEEWGPEFFEPLRASIDRVPFAIVRGNHEAGPPHYEAFLLPPGAKTDYAFRWGPVFFVVIGDGSTDRRADLTAWLDETLSKAAGCPWKVVTRHRPLMSANPRRGLDLRGLVRWSALFERHGVDMVVAGHDHFYCRSVPVSVDDGGRGAVHLTLGGGGAPLYEGEEYGWVEAYRKEYHYAVARADASRLSVEVRDGEGELFDSVALAKAAPPRGVSWKPYAAGQAITRSLREQLRRARKTAKGSTREITLGVMNPLPRPLKLRVALGAPGNGEWGFDPPFHDVAVEAEDLAEVRLRVRFPSGEEEPPPEVRVTVVKDR